VQEVEGRRSEAEGGEDHPRRMIQSRDELIMERMMRMRMRMRMTMMKRMPSHLVHLRLLSCLRRSSKKKPLWRMVHMSWMI
jgi:hypothetical protein